MNKNVIIDTMIDLREKIAKLRDEFEDKTKGILKDLPENERWLVEDNFDMMIKTLDNIAGNL